MLKFRYGLVCDQTKKPSNEKEDKINERQTERTKEQKEVKPNNKQTNSKRVTVIVKMWDGTEECFAGLDTDIFLPLTYQQTVTKINRHIFIPS